MYGNACLYYAESILTRINVHSPWNSAVIVDNRSIGPEILKVSATSNEPKKKHLMFSKVIFVIHVL